MQSREREREREGDLDRLGGVTQYFRQLKKK